MIWPAYFNKQRCLGCVAALLWLLTQVTSATGTGLRGKVVFSTQGELCIIDLEDRHSWKSPLKIVIPSKSDMIGHPRHPAWMPDGDSIMLQCTLLSNNMVKYSLGVISIKDKTMTPFGGHLFEKSGYLTYPKWSPNGRFLAVLDYQRTDFIEGKDETIIEIKDFYRLTLLDNATQRIRTFDRIYATRAPFSWSADSGKIAYETSDRQIAVYSLDSHTATILDEGHYPVFHPMTGQIFYVGKDSHLYKIGADGTGRSKVDDGDWSWSRLIGIADDGKGLLFIGGGSYLPLPIEYTTIDVYDLVSRDRRTVSKKYSSIYGASLSY